MHSLPLTYYTLNSLPLSVCFTELSPLDREPCCWGGGLPSGGADHPEEAREAGQGGVQRWGAGGGGTDLWTEETGGAGCRGKVGMGEGEGLSS